MKETFILGPCPAEAETAQLGRDLLRCIPATSPSADTSDGEIL